MRGGFAHLRIATDEPRFDDFDGGTNISFVRDDSHGGRYVGVGFGWRWSEQWSSSVELTRLYGDVAFGCNEFGDCSTTQSGHFDLATFGVAYDFD